MARQEVLESLFFTSANSKAGGQWLKNHFLTNKAKKAII
jgi:hypothetical protein